eukprot:1156896-Pelagomonas_calceolata.AAC.15
MQSELPLANQWQWCLYSADATSSAATMHNQRQLTPGDWGHRGQKPKPWAALWALFASQHCFQHRQAARVHALVRTLPEHLSSADEATNAQDCWARILRGDALGSTRARAEQWHAMLISSSTDCLLWLFHVAQMGCGGFNSEVAERSCNIESGLAFRGLRSKERSLQSWGPKALPPGGGVTILKGRGIHLKEDTAREKRGIHPGTGFEQAWNHGSVQEIEPGAALLLLLLLRLSQLE